MKLKAICKWIINEFERTLINKKPDKLTGLLLARDL